MALETIKHLTHIGGFKIDRSDDSDIDGFVSINEDVNAIAFRIQKGPIKEVGVNGCQVDTLISAAKAIIVNLDTLYPSRYNTKAIDYLQGALDELEERKKEREQRGVEGTSNA